MPNSWEYTSQRCTVGQRLNMSVFPHGCCLLALLVIGLRPAYATTTWNGNDIGCNGIPRGIPCCEDGFVAGDNEGGKNYFHFREEIFIQAYDYITSCAHTCKVLHEDSVGITESVREQYSSGRGKNKNKCWCEFGEPKLNSDNQEYKTCLFKSISEEPLPSDVAIFSEGSVLWSGIQMKIWGNEECKNIGNFGNLNFELEDCKKKCLETAGCTAINYNKVSKHCVPKGCTQPVQPPQFQLGDYRGYYIIDKKGSMSEEYLPSDVEISSEAHETPEFYLVSTKGEAGTSVSSEKMGLYRKKQTGIKLKNNFPVWKNEKEEQYLFLSDNQHWGIGPDYNNDLFGLLNYEDKPAPTLPHLGKNWMFWARGKEWRKDSSIQVLEGDTEDAGVDREIIFLEHTPLVIENVDDASHCCQTCKEQADPIKKDSMGRTEGELYHTKVFNYDKGLKSCDCMNLSGVYGPAIAVFTRYNPHVTSGLCDTRAKFELERRTGRSGPIRTASLGTKHYYNKDTYNYTDVQGPLGEGRMFYQGNLLHEDNVKPDGPMDHDSCCRECQKRNPNIQLEYHNALSTCHCLQVKPGTRPVTIPAHKQQQTSFAGICNTTISPSDVELLRDKFPPKNEHMMVWELIDAPSSNQSTTTLPPQ